MNTDAGRNPFLSRLMGAIRRTRPQLPPDQCFINRVERIPAGLFGEVWFRTAGCQWDRQGGCTMCNYGISDPPDPDAMVAFVQKALNSFDQPIDQLLVSPSGSMLDPREVPPEVRRRIYALIAAYPVPSVLIESRSELVTEFTAAEYRDSQPAGRRVALEIGVESADSWVRRFCINKGSSSADFARAARVAHDCDLEVYANVSLGTAFLSATEAINDTVETVRWALDNGATRAVVFPLHVKPHTLLDVLRRHGNYTPPSLWSLVEVLRRLGQSQMPRIEIAWYRSYYNYDAKINQSPDSCPRCREVVLTLLDDYRATQTPDPINALLTCSCSCQAMWAASRDADKIGRADRAAAAYRFLAAEFGLEDWLTAHGSSLIEALHAPPTPPQGA
jgi:radical SAM enzyme (TIGR01210 family)